MENLGGEIGWANSFIHSYPLLSYSYYTFLFVIAGIVHSL